MRANPYAERPVPNECLSCVWNLMFETEERALVFNTLLRSRMSEPEPPHIAIHWIMNCEWEASIALPTEMAAGNRPAPQGRLRCHCGICPSASGGTRQAA